MEPGDLVLIANAGDGTISTLRLVRGDTPRLVPLATSGGLPGCGTFAIDAQRDLVYAAYKGEPAGIATLQLDRTSGVLTEIARRPVEASITYLSLTEDYATLLGASYGGDFGAAWPVADGILGEPHSRFVYRNPHCIVTAGRFAYAVCLGEDLIAQFSLGEGGLLEPLDPPTAAAPQGSGPRHLLLDGANAYLVTEYSGEAVRYVRADDGTLSAAEAVLVVDPAQGLAHSRFGADPRAEHLIWGADVHRAGEVLVTSERSSSLLTTTALGAGGELGEVVAYTPTVTQPRGFGVSPDGAFVVAVGERATDAELLRVEADGTLTSLGLTPVGHAANWVRYV